MNLPFSTSYDWCNRMHSNFILVLKYFNWLRTQTSTYFSCSLELTVQKVCAEHLYGPRCDKLCVPQQGSSYCSEDGETLCYPGMTNTFCLQLFQFKILSADFRKATSFSLHLTWFEVPNNATVFDQYIWLYLRGRIKRLYLPKHENIRRRWFITWLLIITNILTL